MKYFLLTTFLFCSVYCNAQIYKPKLEIVATPGLFVESTSYDSLLPAHQKRAARIGDVTSYAMQLSLPLKNERWTVKAGIGFSQRHFSINKYTLDDFFIALFAFDAQPHRDSFNLSRIKFTDNYFQVPLSCSYTVTRPLHNFQLAFGINVLSNFLITAKANLTFDSTYKTPAASDIAYAKNVYTHNASKYVCTIQPYAEASFLISKKLGLLFQSGFPSYYSSRLDKRLTTSTIELFSFTFGATLSLK
ncbi:MAG: outer membrane beta-barrel protein [Parafilimonas sp.]|nr:outer membrane beta-barrel protein [Parafilimonas sp.]